MPLTWLAACGAGHHIHGRHGLAGNKGAQVAALASQRSAALACACARVANTHWLTVACVIKPHQSVLPPCCRTYPSNQLAQLSGSLPCRRCWARHATIRLPSCACWWPPWHSRPLLTTPRSCASCELQSISSGQWPALLRPPLTACGGSSSWRSSASVPSTAAPPHSLAPDCLTAA